MITDTLSIDIVVVTYNSADTIRKCLESTVLVEAKHRLYVVDNGSTDETLEIVATTAPHAQILKGHGNIGFGAAVNLGAAAGSGNIVMVVNPDAYLEIGVNAVVDVAHRLESVTTGYMRGQDGSLRSNVFRFPRLRSVLKVSEASISPADIAAKMERLGSNILAVDYVEGSLVVVPRSLWKVINGFSPSYFMYGEDRDLSYRARENGFSTVIVGTVAFSHDGGFSPQRQNWYAVGILVYYLENRRNWFVLTYVMVAAKFVIKSTLAIIRHDREEAKASLTALASVIKMPFRRRTKQLL